MELLVSLAANEARKSSRLAPPLVFLALKLSQETRKDFVHHNCLLNICWCAIVYHVQKNSKAGRFNYGFHFLPLYSTSSGSRCLWGIVLTALTSVGGPGHRGRSLSLWMIRALSKFKQLLCGSCLYGRPGVLALTSLNGRLWPGSTNWNNPFPPLSPFGRDIYHSQQEGGKDKETVLVSFPAAVIKMKNK